MVVEDKEMKTLNKNSAALLKHVRTVPYRLRLCVLLACFIGLALALHPLLPNSAAQEQATITFAVIGDYGSNDANQLSVANLVKSWNPDFIITVGDNNYPDGEAATIDASIGKYYQEFIYPYAGSYGAGATVNRFWPSVGNHDWDNQTGAKLQPYLDYFTLPHKERYYDFVQGPAHFFVIDSDNREPDGITSNSTQAHWLRNKLAASNAPWKVVYFHHPPYSSRTSFTSLQWPFREWGANVVLAGHTHIYERVLKDGFPYIVNGLGGESLGSFSTAIEGSLMRYGSDYGAMRVTASADVITFEFITRAGTLIDTYTINRNAPVPASPGKLTATTFSTGQIDLAWADNSEGEDGFKIEQATDGVNYKRIATVGPNITAYSNINLQTATTYHYRVRAFTYDKNSGYSNSASASTTTGAPDAPTNLTAVAASASQINLTWTDNSAKENGFEIERCAQANCTDFTRIAEVAANTTTFEDAAGLAAGATYRYRVRAFNDSSDSDYSNTAEAKTHSIQSVPTAPGDLAAAGVSSVQIDLDWSDNSNNEDGFRIYRSTDKVKFTKIATVGPNVTSYQNTARQASTTYYYRVQAFNVLGNSPFSNTASATTFAPATVKPQAPGNLVAKAISGSEITLTWTDTSNNEDGFKVYRSIDKVNFTQIAKPGTNATSFTDTGRAAATTYYYTVRSYNAAGNSASSNTASATTP